MRNPRQGSTLADTAASKSENPAICPSYELDRDIPNGLTCQPEVYSRMRSTWVELDAMYYWPVCTCPSTIKLRV